LITAFRRSSNCPRNFVPASVRNFPQRDHPGEPFSDGRLADSGITNQHGIVLATTAQHLNRALDLVIAPDQRVDVARLGAFVEVRAKRLQRIAADAVLVIALGLVVRLATAVPLLVVIVVTDTM
jgi:hypothetical protein